MPTRRRAPRILIALLTVPAMLPGSGAGAERPPNTNMPTTIEIEIADRAELEQLTHLVSIDHVRGHRVRAYATPSQLDALKVAGWSWRTVPTAIRAVEPTMCGMGWERDDDRSWDCYPSYQQYEALMSWFATEYPTSCRLVDLGPTNNLGRTHRLWAVIISDHPDDDEYEPEVLLTSTMHGDETSGFVLMLRLIDHLTRGYGSEPEITALVDRTEIWINPLANPDGTYFGGDHTVADAIRHYVTSTGNASEVDGNRNFPDFEEGDHPDGHPWWPETEAMIALANAKTFVLSANFHGGAEVVNYPWDTVERRHPDDAWFRALAWDWAELAQADGPIGYMTSVNNNGITRGWDWYPVHGGRQDYMTYFHGGRELTIELSETKLLPAEELDDMWQWNRRALLDFLAHAHQGIRGVVTNRRGAPLAATVEVVGVDRDQDGSIVRTDPAVGDFHRLLLPGFYDLRIEANGYQPRVIRGVAVTEGGATEIDVALDPVLRRRPTYRRGQGAGGNSIPGTRR